MRDIIIALATAAVMWLAGWVRTFLARRVRVQSPEAKTLEQVVPAVNALLDTQGPQTEALIALLEATQGQCNGNVDRALARTREARDNFQGFLSRSARVEAPR